MDYTDDLAALRTGAETVAYLAAAAAASFRGLSGSLPATIDLSAGMGTDPKPESGSCMSNPAAREQNAISLCRLRVMLMETQELLSLVTRAIEEDPAVRATATARIRNLIPVP